MSEDKLVAFREQLTKEGFFDRFKASEEQVATEALRAAMYGGNPVAYPEGFIGVDYTFKDAASNNIVMIDTAKIPKGLNVDIVGEVEKYKTHFIAENPDVDEDAIPLGLMVGNLLTQGAMGVLEKNGTATLILHDLVRALFPQVISGMLILVETRSSSADEGIFKIDGYAPLSIEQTPETESANG